MAPTEAEPLSKKRKTTANAGSFNIRECKEDDADTLADICFRAFKQFNETAGLPIELDFDSIEMTTGIIRGIITAKTFSVAAVEDGTGHLLGSGFLHHDAEVYSIGPISVDPEASNKGVGRAIMTSLLNKANEKEKAKSIRLVQTANNAKSFSLYTSLGFDPCECYSVFQGRLKPEQAKAAAFAVGFATNTDSEVRIMEEADIPACAALFKKVMGYDREQSIRGAMGVTCWVLTSKTGEILGYTTGFYLFGHTVAQSEADYVTLCCGIIGKAEIEIDSRLSFSARLHPQLARWALAAKLSLVRHQWYMVIGEYKAPPANAVYSPTVKH